MTIHNEPHQQTVIAGSDPKLSDNTSLANHEVPFVAPDNELGKHTTDGEPENPEMVHPDHDYFVENREHERGEVF